MKSDQRLIWQQVSGGRARDSRGNYGLQTRRRNHTPVQPVRFLPGREVFAALDEADAASGQRDLDAIASEPPASGADQSGRDRAAGGNARDASDTITFPHFEPDPNDPDEDVTVAAFPNSEPILRTPMPPHKARSVARAAAGHSSCFKRVPTFLWLRARFATFTTTNGARWRTRRRLRQRLPWSQRPASQLTPGQANRLRLARWGPGQLPRQRRCLPRRPACCPTAAPVASRNAPPPSPAGSVSVVAPVPMQVYRVARLIGTTKAKTITLPVGNHDLEFISEDVGYRAKRSVAVHVAQTTQVRLEAPMGMLNVNATPTGRGLD